MSRPGRRTLGTTPTCQNAKWYRRWRRGSGTMTLAIDPASRPRGRITFGDDHVRPPFVVFVSIASLWTGGPRLGITKRAHTAYATPARSGSAVRDPLSGSVRAVGMVSATGAVQCAPPSLDVVADELART